MDHDLLFAALVGRHRLQKGRRLPKVVNDQEDGHGMPFFPAQVHPSEELSQPVPRVVGQFARRWLDLREPSVVVGEQPEVAHQGRNRPATLAALLHLRVDAQLGVQLAEGLLHCVNQLHTVEVLKMFGAQQLHQLVNLAVVGNRAIEVQRNSRAALRVEFLPDIPRDGGRDHVVVDEVLGTGDALEELLRVPVHHADALRRATHATRQIGACER
mmetsp:Transcript_11246/g.32453  ORF Transcript_11246/g.32453 Transcript_11246/m.32453 type:complete len:214 (+) Transcript_11246:1169-1810(+)